MSGSLPYATVSRVVDEALTDGSTCSLSSKRIISECCEGMYVRVCVCVYVRVCVCVCASICVLLLIFLYSMEVYIFTETDNSLNILCTL